MIFFYCKKARRVGNRSCCFGSLKNRQKKNTGKRMIVYEKHMTIGIENRNLKKLIEYKNCKAQSDLIVS